MPAAAAKTQPQSDHDILTALNTDYINSVQNSDVKRFDEILAIDFYCSNPDGSLVDRAAFFAQTAKPVPITNLRAEDVLIRIVGDFAVIHARTAFTKPDGTRAAAATPTATPGSAGNGLRCSRTSRGCSAAVNVLARREGGAKRRERSHVRRPWRWRGRFGASAPLPGVGERGDNFSEKKLSPSLNPHLSCLHPAR